MTYQTNLSESNECWSANVLYMLSHIEFAVRCDTKFFFTEGTKCTSEFPIRIDKGKGKLTDNLCDFRSIDSVLLSFNWSLLCVIHNLTSVIQLCIITIADWIWSGTVSLYNRLSSANAWCLIEFSWSVCTICVQDKKKGSPMTEPWGTPKWRGASPYPRPLTVTIWVISERYEPNQGKVESLITKACSSRRRKVLLFMVIGTECNR